MESSVVISLLLFLSAFQFSCSEEKLGKFLRSSNGLKEELNQVEKVLQTYMKSNTKGCPPGVPTAMCSADPCLGATCAGHPSAKCIQSYCGTCHPVFYNQAGEKLKCQGEETHPNNVEKELSGLSNKEIKQKKDIDSSLALVSKLEKRIAKLKNEIKQKKDTSLDNINTQQKKEVKVDESKKEMEKELETHLDEFSNLERKINILKKEINQKKDILFDNIDTQIEKEVKLDHPKRKDDDEETQLNHVSTVVKKISGLSKDDIKQKKHTLFDNINTQLAKEVEADQSKKENEGEQTRLDQVSYLAKKLSKKEDKQKKDEETHVDQDLEKKISTLKTEIKQKKDVETHLDLISNLEKKISILKNDIKQKKDTLFDGIDTQQEKEVPIRETFKKEIPVSPVISQPFKKEVSISQLFKKENEGNCKNLRADCSQLIQVGYCKTNEKDMKKNCAKGCGFCIACEDLAGVKCKAAKSLGLCEKSTRLIEKKCAKTCGYCVVPHEPQCALTQHGCCWDKKTTKSNGKGTNCPECKDKYKALCKTFKSDCMNAGQAGKFVREYCSKTCNVCGVGESTSCIDDPAQSRFCPTGRQAGWCDNRKDLMQVYCRATCGLC